MATTITAGRRPRTDGGWGNPIVYFAALLLIGVMIGPVVYIILGGFRTNSQITVSPAGSYRPCCSPSISRLNPARVIAHVSRWRIATVALLNRIEAYRASRPAQYASAVRFPAIAARRATFGVGRGLSHVGLTWISKRRWGRLTSGQP